MIIRPTRAEIVALARSYKGTPFIYHGRDRKGVDCVGLLVAVARDLGMDVEDTTDYTRNPESVKLNAMLKRQTDPASLTSLRSGQIAKFRQSVFPMHTGILVVEDGGVTVINANLKKKQVVEQSFHDWKHLLLEVREYKGVR